MILTGVPIWLPSRLDSSPACESVHQRKLRLRPCCYYPCLKASFRFVFHFVWLVEVKFLSAVYGASDFSFSIILSKGTSSSSVVCRCWRFATRYLGLVAVKNPSAVLLFLFVCFALRSASHFLRQVDLNLWSPPRERHRLHVPRSLLMFLLLLSLLLLARHQSRHLALCLALLETCDL